MATTHQITSVDTDRLILGNYAISTSLTSGGTFVALGPGMLTAFAHNFTNSNIQSGNSIDPLEYIADESATFSVDVLEYDASVLSAIQGGLTNTTGITTTGSTLRAGGATNLTKRAFKLTNVNQKGGASITTVITIFKASVEGGMTLGVKSDNDADPINVYQFAFKAENDSTLTAGAQLFTIVKTGKP